MRGAVLALGRRVRHRPGLTWVLATTSSVVIVSVAGSPPQVRLPFVLIFFLTVPGFLLLDLRQPTDITSRIVIGVAGSVSFYIVCVSIALLTDVTWIAPATLVFLVALIVWGISRRRRRAAEGSGSSPDDGGFGA